MNKKLLSAFILSAISTVGIYAQQTEIQYLSGTGLNETVEWDFLCSDGQNSGSWSKIGVPSQWELQGFGDYTYGRWYVEKGRQPSKETGTYRFDFQVPEQWKGKIVNIVFDGVMTDATVKINGKSAGEKHQGAFYQFRYDISKLLNYSGNNQLEVFVEKHSSNNSINNAERKADWWLFGGIFRPVWLEARPQNSIAHVAVDAQQNGDIAATISLSGSNKGASIEAELSPIGDDETFATQTVKLTSATETQKLNFHFDNVKTWDCESPNMYRLTLSLCNSKGEIVHSWSEKIGFRTVEFRPKDGIYVNGTKIIMKGINRHSFHPDGGRTTNKQLSIEDAELLKYMNINAVRSHYPPDIHFLDACDSLGLFVIDELAGWQNCYDNEVGPKLQREMLERDVNHPCIVLWSNGNEGGWNYNLDAHFADYDPQNRHVIHPWADFDQLDTHHYPAFLTGVARFTNGYNVFMPTEFMHGQYDQGHGAGLEDFWLNYTSHPLFAGGFMWAFSDEAVKRTDKNGILDSETFNAPDGIVGPYREKEGSVFTVREVWSPIQFKQIYITPSFDGNFVISNKFLYSNLSSCTMNYNVVKLTSPFNGSKTTTIANGEISVPDIEPGLSGKLHIDLPENFFDGDVLSIEAFDKQGKSIGEWSWPIHYTNEYLEREHVSVSKNSAKASFVETDSTVMLTGGKVSVTFRKSDGTIINVTSNNKNVSFGNGPIAVGMKIKYQNCSAHQDGENALFTARYLGGIDTIVWRMTSSGLLEMDAVMLNRANGGQGFDDAFADDQILNLGLTFSYLEDGVSGMTWFGRGPYRVWKNRIKGTQYNIWHKAYNNTITGETHDGKLEYPEFKGFHANIYWASIEGNNPFTVYSATDGLFMHVFTPQEPDGRQNGKATMPQFPQGDISFLLDIPAIRSFKPISQHGPHSQPGNVRVKQGDEGLKMNLIFDFNAIQ